MQELVSVRLGASIDPAGTMVDLEEGARC